MSQPCSLYVQVTMQPPQFAAFLAASSAQPTVNANWEAWWDSRKLDEKWGINDFLYGYEKNIANQEAIDAWLAREFAIAASIYDPETGVWRFSVNEFSENYGEILPTLAFLEGVLPFREENPADFAVVYDFFYGGDSVMAFMDFVQGQMRLDPNICTKSQLDPAKLAQAEAHLQRQWDIFEQNREDD